ncbi:MAG TPA: HAD family phosphatase [Pelolinea sp.]|nr:HAD family phosphatase [Pelolinea sp.]
MAVKAVIFDLAGVVLLTVKGTFNSLLAERLGARLEDVVRVMSNPVNDQWDFGEIGDDEFFEHLLTELKEPLEKKAILTKFVIDDFYVDQELLTYIRELHKTYTTALLTNFPAHLHDYMKTAWRVDGAFDHIIASCDVKLLKPDPRMYQAALERINLKPEETVFIDDREVNVKAAEALGIKGIIYVRKEQAIKELDKILE